MNWPGWIRDNTWRWVIGIVIAIAAIAIPLIFSGKNPPPQPDQKIEIKGDQATAIQIKEGGAGRC